jgi:very-short-patch-repair endonuclease
MGYDVEAQVGCSGFRVDLGVKTPGKPGRFILGVECDGAAYHSTHTARDRDRLRQEVLETLGWRIYRVWSPAWIRRRASEVTKLKKVLAEAEREAEVPEDRPSVSTVGDEVIKVKQIAKKLPESQHDALPAWASPYMACQLPSPGISWFEFHDPGCTVDHARGIEKIVKTEGPVHIDLVARRLADAWGLRRIGSRMRDAIELACEVAVKNGSVQREGDILWPARDGFELTVRVPSADDPNSERKLEHVPPEEIALAMIRICHDGSGVERDALISEVARVFGIHRTGSMVAELLQGVLDAALSRGDLVQRGDKLLAT